jgi:hypothetical protein
MCANALLGGLRKLGALAELPRVGERNRARVAARQRTQIVRADQHAGGCIRGRRRRRRKRTREPAFLQILVARRCGVPYLDRAEMGEVGRRVADALQHGQLALAPERDKRRQRRMKSRTVGQRHHIVFRDCELRAQCVIRGIGIRNHRIEAVVAAFQLDQDEELVVADTGRRCGESDARRAERRPRECRCQRSRGCGAQKVAAVHASSSCAMGYLS